MYFNLIAPADGHEREAAHERAKGPYAEHRWLWRFFPAAHALLIQDPALIQEIETLIREQDHAAEYAVSRVMRRHVKAFESLQQSHFSTRAVDLIDIEKAILRNLLGGRGEPLHQLKEPVIVLAHDLTPSETASLDPKMVHAFATEAGGDITARATL